MKTGGGRAPKMAKKNTKMLKIAPLKKAGGLGWIHPPPRVQDWEKKPLGGCCQTTSQFAGQARNGNKANSLIPKPNTSPTGRCFHLPFISGQEASTDLAGWGHPGPQGWTKSSRRSRGSTTSGPSFLLHPGVPVRGSWVGAGEGPGGKSKGVGGLSHWHKSVRVHAGCMGRCTK